MNQQETRAACAIGLLYLVRMLGLFMVIPVMPLFGGDITGATPLLLGVAVGIYGFSQAALQIPLGLASDRFGRRKVVSVGLLVFVFGSLIAALGSNIYLLILGRFLQGCGAVASVLLALLSDLTRVEQRAKAMAIVGIGIGASFGLALVLGPLIAGQAGLPGIFFLSAMLGLVALVLLQTLVPEPALPKRNLDASMEARRLGEVIGDPSLWRINMSIFLLHFQLIAAFSMFPLLMRGTGVIADADHGLYYLALLSLSFVMVTPLIWLGDRLTDVRPLLGITVAIVGGSMVPLFGDTGFWSVAVTMLLFFMGFTLLEVLLPASLSKVAGPGYRGSAMGVYTTCQFFGIFAGGVVGGFLLEYAEMMAIAVINLLLCLGWVLLLLGLPPLGKVGSRTVRLESPGDMAAHERLKALLSLHGVLDAVVIESEEVAYLKVDETTFNDKDLCSLTWVTA